MSSIAEPFVHPALFYRGAEEYLAGTVPFILAGLAAGEPVAVAVPAPNLALIEAALGEHAASVKLLDMAKAGRNPGRIIPGVMLAFAEANAGRVRVIGEPIWAGRTALEYPACLAHEALTNFAFEGREATILCPYDEAGLDNAVLEDAARTHPLLIDHGVERESRRYAPDEVVRGVRRPARPPFFSAELEFDLAGLAVARRFVAGYATQYGLSPSRVEDVTLAVSELCTNSVLHGRGHGTLYVWCENGQLVCEVADGGRITDPLAGRRLADIGQPGGRGLLLVNEVADLVRMHSDADGTTVRAYLNL
ncbi:MAG: prsR [Amycolatopsis sp.]|jgi:anti-sigma regulatory factor (Ser/Thr protein kinase)|uniref:sensor histidine kinase n=1 Tax=Amycolatopsis sp. TaxID=37632 RepID=UPI00261653BD|nr:sensor histidine kinase [Amycolatopsis sp.]MCU1681224.1 prsR [Amycolatopsis sp.]